jgi:hypothetical protein
VSIKEREEALRDIAIPIFEALVQQDDPTALALFTRARNLLTADEFRLMNNILLRLRTNPTAIRNVRESILLRRAVADGQITHFDDNFD